MRTAAGEEFVMRYEVARLIAERAERLAAKVERVSVTRGDGLGYDVLSFDRSGAERLIEVKTTRYGASTPFFVSRNELAVSREEASRYQLYRVFGFRETPKFYRKAGQIDREFAIDPAVWEALIAAEQLVNPRVRDDVGEIALVPPAERISGPGTSFVMAATIAC